MSVLYDEHKEFQKIYDERKKSQREKKEWPIRRIGVKEKILRIIKPSIRRKDAEGKQGEHIQPWHDMSKARRKDAILHERVLALLDEIRKIRYIQNELMKINEENKMKLDNMRKIMGREGYKILKEQIIQNDKIDKKGDGADKVSSEIPDKI